MPDIKEVAIAAAIALLLGALAGAAGAWAWQANRYERDIATLKRDQSEKDRLQARADETQLRDEREKRAGLERQLGDLDARHYEELNNAKSENARLAAALAAGTRQLSIRARCTASADGLPSAAGGAGLGDGAAATAVLYGEDAADIQALVADADAIAAALRFMQDRERDIQAQAATREPQQ
ncbi:lysis system i-spanin subunit Rz [Ralstonia solanacearum]|uniref:lysis system i-spanin subunit Rz n=1 Tax=Ralstonia solanacearum TaxID=305 RepID=UPI00168AF177|nr:lysis system i-spanin subunit Rz [Ralstonia solanacearum]QNT25523.1 lysis protein [Ralstonia solanacearum]QNT63162.1 lysis protein [Ralstonia solanacearum]